MKFIDLQQEVPSVHDLLRLAAEDQVRIRDRDGKEFILELADAFDREVGELSRSERFMSLLTDGPWSRPRPVSTNSSGGSRRPSRT